MLFVTPEFAIFFLIVAMTYFILPHRWRWVLLLAASYYFYASWNINYLSLIILSTFVDYAVGYFLGKTPFEQQNKRKVLLALSVVTNLGILFTFKYYNFFMGSLISAFENMGYSLDIQNLKLLLPVGISFYTFQSMSYTIDIYRGRLEPERNFGIFATFIAFFPQLVAGPIERARNMLPQFYEKHEFSYIRAVEGFRLILWGTFKKVAIADRSAVVVNAVYGAPDEYSGLSLILATVFFAIQIYCDFSGYTDIAIGVAKVMGYDLMLNFRQPYFAKSIQEFWQRWHISLSTWFRDYLYIPLGGNRVSFGRYLLNIMIVFLVSGLWHGAGWTFAIWGALHGFYMVIEASMRHLKITILPNSIPNWIRDNIARGWTFLLVTFAWVFFRAADIDSAFYILSNMFRGSGKDIISTFDGAALSSSLQMLITLVAIAILLVYDVVDSMAMEKDSSSITQRMSNWSTLIRWGLYYGIVSFTIVAFVLSIGSLNDFIYFQF